MLSQDVKVALAYGAQRNGRSSWALAHALLAAILEAQADNTPAALAIQTALELRPWVTHWQQTLERLMRRIPDEYAKALQVRPHLKRPMHSQAEVLSRWMEGGGWTPPQCRYNCRTQCP